ncbi:MAG: N-acetylmuramidase family protein [Bacteroidota bacterium]
MITNQQFEDAAELLGTEVAAIKAVYEVEAAGKGYLPDGRVKILFEGHIFWKQIKKAGKEPIDFITQNTQYMNVLYPKWDKKQYKGGEAEWNRMGQAMEVCAKLNLSPELALDSASYGSFQILGLNAELCGYTSAQDMLSQYNLKGEAEQLASFIRFVKSTHLDDELKNKEWAKFAQGYNGSQFALNKYDQKLANAYNKHK